MKKKQLTITFRVYQNEQKIYYSGKPILSEKLMDALLHGNETKGPKKNADLNFREVSKKVNEDWKELSEKAKKKWTKEATEDKKRYEKELKKWQDEQTSESSEEELTRTRYNGRKKPIPRPVGVRNCFQLYMKDKKKELKKADPKISFEKMNKKVSKGWKNISEKNKKKYVKMAQDDKKRYKKEMKQYEKDRPKTTSESESSSD